MKNRLKVARAEKDLTQEDLAKLIGVSRQSINAIESGRYVPSTVLALKMAQVFGKSVEEIFFLEDEDWFFSHAESAELCEACRTITLRRIAIPIVLRFLRAEFILSSNKEFLYETTFFILNPNEIHSLSQTRHINLLGFIGNVAW